jgi:hypothetical protein
MEFVHETLVQMSPLVKVHPYKQPSISSSISLKTIPYLFFTPMMLTFSADMDFAALRLTPI